MEDLPKHLTRAEAAKYLKVSLPTLGRRIKCGDLQTVKVGGLVRVLASSILKLMTVKKPNKKG